MSFLRGEIEDRLRSRSGQWITAPILDEVEELLAKARAAARREALEDAAAIADAYVKERSGGASEIARLIRYALAAPAPEGKPDEKGRAD